MARKKRSGTGRRRTVSKKGQTRIVDNLVGIILAFLMLIGLFNLGAIGQILVGLFSFLVGRSYPVAMILVLISGLSLTFFGHQPRYNRRWISGFVIAYCGGLIWLHYLMFNHLNLHANFISITWSNLTKVFFQTSNSTNIGGGMVGAFLYTGSNYLIGRQGTAFLAWLMIIVGIIIFFAIPWEQYLSSLGRQLKNIPMLIRRVRQSLLVQPRMKQPVKEQITSLADQLKPVQKDSKNVNASQHPVTPKVAEPRITVASTSNDEASGKSQKSQELQTSNDDLQLATTTEKEDTDYQLPPLSLLTKIPQTDQKDDLHAIKKNTKKLQDTLKSFGVDATVENVNLGPSVTKYELRPAVGVKVSRITHLADDLALALAAKDIRIEAPIPGKSLIGIEVPNQQIATVGFRDMVESMPHDDQPMNVPLGRTVTGDVMMADLTKMPHLLIAGATGSGKSVAINDIITSILLKAKPHQVKFLMIDPKKVELSVYNGIPHLLSPVVSEPKKAAKALAKVVAEMEHRYELFAQFGVRNLNGYNQLVRENNEQEDATEQPALPLILVIVDELADLMMTVSHDVEDAIVRIAQMGRAAGIHMILATQRPSVDVITGLIKANVPSRIAFAVSSGVDSRTIIDTNGAEKLLGRGDMLFEPIDQNKPVRVQGAFISDQDVEAVVDFIKKERPAEYDQKMVVTDNEIEQEEKLEDEDELFPEALAFVVDQQKASTSLIQRRFRIGYNRAARIIDDMEQRGYIGPANGSKPREVFKKKSQDEE
ncbi:FtsK/SpoIIIE family DNA translocase [Limosilactobacillus fastidiosus]|uniref:DNA translocase FtsK n=1 Tax=Limosilactobacillus fastidiosus TaxID=2759855 RepID=A0A7W3TYA5_9LACO|nr:DNA translocase FtsK [Limosilactobacillus fastidiosus]MBB1062369.1 cell division protein FtsK [Limosilactobacillus fastidiosus]MBB1085280.1 cell division protein FtsK [Limosilactobacillus fastidiosus]MCD7083444.1 DNA translocase FtsK [Limosilactobacillus fastidiosus]MCD7085264.1 DNA translocase FtsK [Limosilactobacillus fastidiosus]MCD7115207.1 DNA translocase FtsK [Limosilactobacillus fastidiosus]